MRLHIQHGAMLVSNQLGCLYRHLGPNFDDKSAQANPDVAFAWQSGHRLLQRA
jgi:hypothetical protein